MAAVGFIHVVSPFEFLRPSNPVMSSKTPITYNTVLWTTKLNIAVAALTALMNESEPTAKEIIRSMIVQLEKLPVG